VLLAWVLAAGVSINGAKRWIAFGAFNIQPSEWTKLSLILYLAAIISNKGEGIRQFKKGLLPIVIVTGVVLAMVMMQPDFGTMSILFLISLVCVMIGGADLRQLLLLGLCTLPLLAYIMLNQDYRMKRLVSFLSPLEDPSGSGYQVIQSLMALGHGGLTGAGLGKSVQKLNYLPEAHTDFIFAVIGEELGFMGTSLFLLLFFLFLWRGFVAAARCQDPFGFIVGMGIVAMVFIQLAFNLGAVVGILPVTGVPLPFVSYGGSALIVDMAGAGILLSLSRGNTPAWQRIDDRKPTGGIYGSIQPQPSARGGG